MENTCTVFGNAPVTADPGIDLGVAFASKPFQDWVASVDQNRFRVDKVHIQSVDMFGSRVGFIKFVCDVFDAANGKKLSGIIFARGGSVAILAILDCEGEEYVVLTVQPRLASGCFAFEEVCAGMLDGSGNFAGVAAKEMAEELQVVINEKELSDLTGKAGMPRGAFPSPGACDETIRMFLWRRTVTREELTAMNGRCTGALDEGEQITLKIVKLDYLMSIPDLKTIAAYALYKQFCK